MSQVAIAHDALLPRAPGGNLPGAALALVVHAALALALTTAVDWRTRTPDIVSAELWASVPQVAAPKAEEAPSPVATPVPPPVAPPAATPKPPSPTPQAAPQPTEADIAIERAERRKADTARKKAEAELVAERKRLDAENRKAEADKKKRETAETKAEEDRLARQREENLRRMMGQAAGTAGPSSQTSTTGGTGTAALSAAPSAAYAGRLVALIRSNSVFTGTVPGNPAVEVEVRAAANGTIIARRVLKPSGYKDWDEAVLRAIDRASTLPRDVDGRVPTTVIVSFRPYE